MFKIHKRTIHISTSENSQPLLENQFEKNSRSSISNILAIPAIIAGAIVEARVFSVFFAVADSSWNFGIQSLANDEICAETNHARYRG